jgi:prevent-host-death family protein
MSIVEATELKNDLGKYLEASVKEPVVIEEDGRKIAVLVSVEFFENLEKMEEAYWAMRALEAEAEGYLGTDKSLEELRRVAEGTG